MCYKDFLKCKTKAILRRYKKKRNNNLTLHDPMYILKLFDVRFSIIKLFKTEQTDMHYIVLVRYSQCKIMVCGQLIVLLQGNFTEFSHILCIL